LHSPRDRLKCSDRFKTCVRNAVESAQIDTSEIDYPLLVGGSSPLPGLREAMAEALDRPLEEIHVCTSCEHLVAAGGARRAYFPDQASTAFESGLGFKIFDRLAESYRNILFVSPGQVIPPEGLFLERAGFSIDTRGGIRELLCQPFACRTGVRATVTEHRDTVLEDSEIVSLANVKASLEDFPDGDHQVSLGIKLGPGLAPRLLARPLGLPHVEPLSIPLVLAPSDREDPVRIFSGWLLVLLIDLSKSMAGEKLSALCDSIRRFTPIAESHKAEIAIVCLRRRRGRKSPGHRPLRSLCRRPC